MDKHEGGAWSTRGRRKGGREGEQIVYSLDNATQHDRRE
eukprot:COSAG02_NODE_70300_length_196_cov_82.020619_1_plen_38_part_01